MEAELVAEIIVSLSILMTAVAYCYSICCKKGQADPIFA